MLPAKADIRVGDLLLSELGDDGLRALAAGGVWLGRKRATSPDAIVTKAEELRVYLSPIQRLKFKILPELILFEDAFILVINKPPAVSAVSDRACMTYNITYGVHQYYKSQGNTYVPSPINRLDFMVQGIMLFAKSKEAELTLFKLTLKRKIKKYYEAHLEPQAAPPRCLRIKDRLAFLNKGRVDPDGKESESLFILKESRLDADIYGVVLLTGRRHQIRIHAAHYLRPIRFDSLYGPTENNDAEPIGLRAIALNFKAFGNRYRFRLTNK
jgi:23S rRNA pseudouridine1911/1915/1917 synthase